LHDFGSVQRILLQAAHGHSPVVREDQRLSLAGCSDVPCPDPIDLESERVNSSNTSFSTQVISAPENSPRIFKSWP